MRVWAITGMPKKKGGEWFYFLLFCSIFAYAVFRNYWSRAHKKSFAKKR
jgi:hypothetical protein